MKNHVTYSILKGCFTFLSFIFLIVSFGACTEDDGGEPHVIGDLEILIPDLELLGPTGSTIGPGGDLFVAESVTGKIWRIDLQDNSVTEFASGLPQMVEAVGLGGVMDVVFIGETAFALVSLVGPQFGNDEINGIYRITGPNTFEVVADIGQFAVDNEPTPEIPFEYFVDMGVLYAMEVYNGGILVTDGHYNRVYFVTLDGNVSEVKTFNNIAPTGLEIDGSEILMAQAGPTDHLPETGKVLSFDLSSPAVSEVAGGARLLVDVEMNGQTLYALSQGFFEPGLPAGAPANPNTGALVRANADGTFTTITDQIDRPTSLEFSGNTAYIVSLSGRVYSIDNVE